jgi:predicted Zn finger-like uncharacterized protein
MKFACDKCSTKYSIADERVKGRVLKIRCKSCNHVITVREEGSQAGKLPKEAPHSMEEALDQFGPISGGENEHTVVSTGPLPGLDDAVSAAAAGASVAASPSDDEWYVSFDGEQEGPMPLDRAVARVKEERPRGKEIHCWRPGFFVWLPLEEVPEFMKALAPPKPAVPAGRPPIPSAAMARPRIPSVVQPSLSRPATTKKDPTGSQPKVSKDPTGPRAALGAIGSARKDPTADKPLPLPPPPEALGAAPELIGPSITKPESKSAYRRAEPTATAKSGAATRSLSDAAAKAAPAKKPLFPELKREYKKPEPVPDNVSPFAAAMTANAGGAAKDAPKDDAKIPDTGPTPLPPPPGDELPIGEASGLLNLSHLAAVASSQKATGQQRASVETFGGQPVATPTGANGIASQPPAPVVVVAGPAPRHTAPWIKAAAVGSALVAIALAGTLIYVLTRPSTPGPVAQAEKDKSRVVDDKPIAFAVPGDPNTIIDPVTKKRVARPAPAKTGASPAAKAGDPYKGLTAEQKRMLELYGQGGDEAKVHQLPSVAGPQKKAQVNEGQLAAVVSQNKNSMGLCYQRSLKHDPTLKSLKMSAHVNIGISGRVTNVSFAEKQYADAEIGQCLQTSIKRWNFPAADGEYEFEFPIVLQAN